MRVKRCINLLLAALIGSTVLHVGACTKNRDGSERKEVIVYTSVDSVFQIAAHQSVIPVPELYRICATARRILKGKHAMGRVIARPFKGNPGKFVRTAARKDFTLPPPARTALDIIHHHKGRTLGIGKIGDLFSNRGLSRVIHSQSNADGIAQTLELIRQDRRAKFLFTNLVDTDMLYGHRNDCEGYYRCLEAFDDALPKLLDSLSGTDVLCITSDHGCDPTTPGTDHTREYVPLLFYGEPLRKGVNLGVRDCFADLGQTILELLGYPGMQHGTSFASKILSRS
jgi:phosphopentomutase